jgi:hypothetical protein
VTQCKSYFLILHILLKIFLNNFWSNGKKAD